MITVVFEEGRNGGVMCRFEGKVSFPEKSGPQPKAGEEWEVLNVSSNPKGTVNFLKLGRMIDHSPKILETKIGKYSSNSVWFDMESEKRSFLDIMPGWENSIGVEEQDIVEVEVASVWERGYSHQFVRPVRIIQKNRDLYGGFSEKELYQLILDQISNIPEITYSDVFRKQDDMRYGLSHLAGSSKDTILQEVNSRIKSAYERKKHIPRFVECDSPFFSQIMDLGYCSTTHTAWCAQGNQRKGKEVYKVYIRCDVSQEEIKEFFLSKGFGDKPEKWHGPVYESTYTSW